MTTAALARLLGLDTAAPPALDGQEKLYLQGFILGLQADASRPLAEVPTLPASAPLAPATRVLLDGMLAGLFSRAGLAGAGPGPQSTRQPEQRVLVLWASQTGHAEGLADTCAQALKQAGREVRLAAMDSVAVDDLARCDVLLCVASTFGDGDPPDNGSALWQALQAADAPMLAGVRAAVLALGDSSYGQFCGFGRQLDARLQALGAQALLPRVDCEPDFDEPAGLWLAAVRQALAATGAHQAQAPDCASPDRPEPLPSRPAATTQHGRHAPLPAPLRLNRLLSGPGAHKETRQYAFDLSGAGSSLDYQAGDALGVWPVNSPVLVGDILDALKLAPSAAVQVKGHGEQPLSEALLRHAELTRITPGLLRFVQQRSGSETLAALLRPGREDELRQWLWGRQPVDLFLAFGSGCGAQELLDLFKPLQPRLYSIASSPKAHPREVHLTVSTVRYACEGRARGGVCSTFLAERAQQAPVPVFVQQSAHFRPPRDPRTAMIMVGPGTGVAPFRAFLQERRADAATGRNWLFFGEQHAETDFYYRDELHALQRDGYLHRLDTAFSRDQASKLYVQHSMLEHGAELWSWLQDGASLYVCGDASRMARDVEAALRQVAQTHGKLAEDQARAYLAQLARDKRYLRDVY